MTNRAIYGSLCFTNNVQRTYNIYLVHRDLSIQSFLPIGTANILHTMPCNTAQQLHDLVNYIMANGIVLQHKIFQPSTVCRACKKEVDKDSFDISVSYWQSLWFPIHKECKAQYEKIEKYACQVIDADCNDCGHFNRKLQNKGFCDKFNIAAVANAKYHSGHICFVHRNS